MIKRMGTIELGRGKGRIARMLKKLGEMIGEGGGRRDGAGRGDFYGVWLGAGFGAAMGLALYTCWYWPTARYSTQMAGWSEGHAAQDVWALGLWMGAFCVAAACAGMGCHRNAKGRLGLMAGVGLAGFLCVMIAVTAVFWKLAKLNEAGAVMAAYVGRMQGAGSEGLMWALVLAWPLSRLTWRMCAGAVAVMLGVFLMQLPWMLGVLFWWAEPMQRKLMKGDGGAVLGLGVTIVAAFCGIGFLKKRPARRVGDGFRAGCGTVFLIVAGWVVGYVAACNAQWFFERGDVAGWTLFGGMALAFWAAGVLGIWMLGALEQKERGDV